MNKKLILLISCVFICAMATRPAASKEDLDNFVKTIIPTCTMGDGYHCLDIAEDDFLNPDSLDKLTPGQYLLAFNAAYQVFSELPELSIEQRHLKHYRIGFTESTDNFIVLFMPLLLPERIENNTPVGFATATFGETVKFWVDKNTNQVTKHLFYK